MEELPKANQVACALITALDNLHSHLRQEIRNALNNDLYQIEINLPTKKGYIETFLVCWGDWMDLCSNNPHEISELDQYTQGRIRSKLQDIHKKRILSSTYLSELRRRKNSTSCNLLLSMHLSDKEFSPRESLRKAIARRK